MRLVIEALSLRLRQPFVIAHGASTTRDNVLVRLVDEGAVDADGASAREGLGEAAAVPYLGESRAGIAAYLEALERSRPALDPLALAHVIDALPPGSAAARAAVDMALHDAFGKALGQPLYRLLGLCPERIPPSSFTIAIGTPEEMARAARAAPLPVLKLKLGAGDSDADDLGRVDAVRAASALPIRVDANAGWSRQRAEWLLPQLAERGIELCEQPLPAGDLDGLRALSRLPRRPAIFADESIKSSADIMAHAGLVDGVVIKLAKSGGIRGALRDITLARALGLDVLLSCMIESSLAVTAAAHIAPLCQHVDLDGPLLIDDDPFEGVLHREGRLVLPDRPGLGVSARAARAG
jgi:L-alanine-DL-glutamate epimerase-like enolase superfamily enzyme